VLQSQHAARVKREQAEREAADALIGKDSVTA
jgi:hypothetical protein